MPDKDTRYTTTQVCQLVQVSKNTLLKWLDRRLIDQPAERTVYQFLWSRENLENIRNYVNRHKR